MATNTFITLISIFSTSFITWIFLALFFSLAQNSSRIFFIVGHYITTLIATLICFSILFKFLPSFSPFYTMIFSMISLFIIELVVFGFFYKQDLWFLNFVDWMVPVMIIANTIYFLGLYLK